MEIPFFGTKNKQGERWNREDERARLSREDAQCRMLDGDIAALEARKTQQSSKESELKKQIDQLNSDLDEKAKQLEALGVEVDQLNSTALQAESCVAELKKARDSAIQSVKAHLITLKTISSKED